MVKAAKNSSISLRSLVFWAACIALALSFGIFVLEKTRVTNIYTKPVAVVKTSETSDPTGIIDYPIQNNTTSSDGSPPNKEAGTDKPIPADNLSGTINFKSVTGGSISLRVTIYQVVDEGSCTLKLSRPSDNKLIVKTSKIISNPSSATCGGFDIPIEEAGPGKWNIDVQLSSGNKTGQISDEITL